MGPSLEVENLVVRGERGRVLLDIPDFSLEAGQRLGIRGPSGAGKSTLLFATAGLAKAPSGRVHWEGTDLMSLNPAGRAGFRAAKIGFVFQDFLFFEELGSLGAALARGFMPWPLVRALLWRFRCANAMFVLLIAISVGIGVELSAQERGVRRATAEATDRFDLIIAAASSEVTVLLATVFLQPTNMPLLEGDIFNAVATHERVALAAPLAFGDSYRSAPIVGTTATFVAHLSDGQIGEPYGRASKRRLSDHGSRWRPATPSSPRMDLRKMNTKRKSRSSGDCPRREPLGPRHPYTH